MSWGLYWQDSRRSRRRRWSGGLMTRRRLVNVTTCTASVWSGDHIDTALVSQSSSCSSCPPRGPLLPSSHRITCRENGSSTSRALDLITIYRLAPIIRPLYHLLINIPPLSAVLRISVLRQPSQLSRRQLCAFAPLARRFNLCMPNRETASQA